VSPLLSGTRGLAVRAAIIAFAGTIVYLNSLPAPFIFDDQTAILNNSGIRQLWPLTVPLSPRADTPLAGRPIVSLTFAINYATSGLDVRAYRLTNIAIHLMAAFALFGLVRRTLLLPSSGPAKAGHYGSAEAGHYGSAKAGHYGSAEAGHSGSAEAGHSGSLTTAFGQHATDLAWVIALIWTLHPLPSETIDYVTQRTESMMGLCYFLTLYFSVRALERPPGRWQIAAIAACAAGMACKESMVTAPLMVVLFDWVFVTTAMTRKIHRTRLYVGLAATWLLLAVLMQSGPRTTVGFATGVSGWTYLLNQAPTLLSYLRFAFWPRHLILDYGIPQPVTLADVWLPVALIVAIGAVVVLLLVRRPPLGFLGAWFFILLAPTSSIVPISTEVGADRRMYVPLAAIVALVVLGAYRMWTSRGLRKGALVGSAAAISVCLLLSIATMERNGEYESKLSILQTTVERKPQPRAYQMLATALFEAGRRQEALQYLEKAREDPVASFMLGVELISEGQYTRGADELERFVRLAPKHVRAMDAREALGRVYAINGNLERATTYLNEVLAADPRRGSAHGFLGGVLIQQGRRAEGVREFQIAADVQPGNADALRQLGIAQGQTGQLEAAIGTFKRAIELNPRSARDHYLLGRALAAFGQLPAAVPYFARAVELDPQDAEAREDLRRAQETIAPPRR
jgi:tetratricopeptide (TPR) repeat protein